MNRPMLNLIGPEALLAVATALLFWFCSRHNSGEGRDAEIMGKWIWAIPFVLAPLAFATILLPDSRTWSWLARAIVSTYVATFVCGYRLICGLGSGAKGQDAAMILLVVLGSVAVAIGATVTGTMILASKNPAVADWFAAHRLLGSTLTVPAMIPIGIGLGFVVTVISGVLLAFYCEVIKR